MYKRNNTVYIIAILIMTILLTAITVYASSEAQVPNVSAKAAVLYQPDTDSLLFRKNHRLRLPMASTTKIMTAVIAMESDIDRDESKPIGCECIGTEGSSAYLKEGDKVTLRELLYALLLQSANDAAVEIACRVGGSVDGFADMMNAKAAELELSSTHFTNPHGLDDSEHYTTAEDLAKLAAYALDIEEFRNVCSTYKKTIATGERVRTYVNHNKLLHMYDGCVGVKTGYTARCGRCLVGAAERDGLRLVSVTLDAPNDWNDHEALLNYGFQQMEMLTLATTYEYGFDIPTTEGKSVRVTNTDELCIPITRKKHTVSEQVILDRFCTLPVKKGDKLGRVEFIVDGKKVGNVDLIATTDANTNETTGIIKRLIKLFQR